MITHWGKWMGAGMGLMMGGPFGAMLGGLAGHAWDRRMAAWMAGAADPFDLRSGGDGLFADRPQALAALLEALRAALQADGRMTAREEAFLAACAEVFGLPPGAAGQGRGGHGPGPAGASSADPYAVLGVDRDADDATVRAAYRRLSREHHPDAVMARGLPKEVVDLANRRMAVINAAWDDVLRLRGLQ
jgi:DnaJ like chaperone protein